MNDAMMKTTGRRDRGSNDRSIAGWMMRAWCRASSRVVDRETRDGVDIFPSSSIDRRYRRHRVASSTNIVDVRLAPRDERTHARVTAMSE